MAETLAERYRFTRADYLAEGGQASVYKGVDTRTGQPVAIKVIYLQGKQCRKNHQREIENLETLRSKYLVEILHMETRQSKAYCVMEFISGGTLRDHLKQFSKVDETTAVRWMCQLTQGLTQAWDQSIIHRDLKPENILLRDTEGRLDAVVCDFGISKCIKQDIAMTMIGTQKYWSPERKNGTKFDITDDVWALGIVFYEMLFGYISQWSGQISVLFNNIEPGSVSPGVYSLFQRMLTEDKNKRISHKELTDILRGMVCVGREIWPSTACNMILASDSLLMSQVFLRQFKEGFQDNCMREMAHMEKMNSRYVLKLISKCVSEGRPSLIYEFFEGGDLWSFSEKSGPISEDLAKKWLLSLVYGLKEIHSHRIFHRNIKAEHILLTTNSFTADVKYFGFQYSSSLEAGGSDCNIGTLPYTAPERLIHHDFIEASDVWSLGCVFFYILENKLAYRMDLTSEELVKAQTRAPVFVKASEECTELILGMLKYKVKDRFTVEQCIAHPFFQYDSIRDLKQFLTDWPFSDDFASIAELGKTLKRGCDYVLRCTETNKISNSYLMLMQIYLTLSTLDEYYREHAANFSGHLDNLKTIVSRLMKSQQTFAAVGNCDATTAALKYLNCRMGTRNEVDRNLSAELLEVTETVSKLTTQMRTEVFARLRASFSS